MPVIHASLYSRTAIITAHGATQTDVVIVNFSQASQRLAQDITAQGGFAVDCDRGGGHCGAPAELVRAQWQFLKAHTFSVRRARTPQACRGVSPATA